jgi:hypothetical protein
VSQEKIGLQFQKNRNHTTEVVSSVTLKIILHNSTFYGNYNYPITLQKDIDNHTNKYYFKRNLDVLVIDDHNIIK